MSSAEQLLPDDQGSRPAPCLRRIWPVARVAFASNPVGAAAPLHRSGPPKAAVVFGCTAGARGL